MRKMLIAAAAMVVAWPSLQRPAGAESVIDRVLGGGDQSKNRQRQDLQRNRDQVDRAREQGRHEGREESRDDARRDNREMCSEQRRFDPDRRELSGSSRDSRELRHDDD
jgi:hypothetical protein